MTGDIILYMARVRMQEQEAIIAAQERQIAELQRACNEELLRRRSVEAELSGAKKVISALLARCKDA